ncbi:MAG: hypothetical protein ACPGUV_00350 [Polyangiales bacterium]
MKLRLRHEGFLIAQVHAPLLLEHGDEICIQHPACTERYEVMQRRVVIDARGVEDAEIAVELAVAPLR